MPASWINVGPSESWGKVHWTCVMMQRTSRRCQATSMTPISQHWFLSHSDNSCNSKNSPRVFIPVSNKLPLHHGRRALLLTYQPISQEEVWCSRRNRIRGAALHSSSRTPPTFHTTRCRRVRTLSRQEIPRCRPVEAVMANVERARRACRAEVYTGRV